MLPTSKESVAQRLGMILGAFVSILGSETVMLPIQLRPLKQMSSARNYLYLCRFKLQDDPIEFVQTLTRLLPEMPAFLIELKELAGVGADKVYEHLTLGLNTQIQRFVGTHLSAIQDYVGINYIDYAGLFTWNNKSYADFMEEAPLPKKMLPFGVYIDSVTRTVKRYSLMLQNDNLLLWHLAHADLLIGRSATPVIKSLDANCKYAVYVDADNVLFTVAYATLTQLLEDPRIVKVMIFTDTGSSRLWQIMQKDARVTIQQVPRVIRDKSLVDLTIVSQVTRGTLGEGTRPILFSGDSDYCVLNELEDLTVIYTPDRQNMNNTYLSELTKHQVNALPCIADKDDTDSKLNQAVARLLDQAIESGTATELSQLCTRRDLYQLNAKQIYQYTSKGSEQINEPNGNIRV